MSYFVAPLARLIEEFNKLPGIGKRTAQRLAFYVINQDRSYAEAFAEAVRKADKEQIALLLGPIPAALPRFRGEYRYQLTLQAQEEEKLRKIVLAAQAEWKKKRRQGIRLHLALNPTNIV